MIAPCHFGLESVLKREITDLGLEVTKTEDGKVYFSGEYKDICRANIFLRTAERVLLLVGEFDASDFDTLFNKTYDIPWENYVPSDGRVWVTKANSIKSMLSATVPVQSVMKKAMAKRLCECYGTEFLPETGAEYPVRVTLLKNHVTVAIDTSGEALHKRGYRQLTTKAPIEETLAAALIMLTPWKHDRILVDPFCGSGTFAIEAALMAMNIAPGINREFTSESWKNLINRKMWYEAADEAQRLQKEAESRNPIIYAYDIDPSVLSLAMKNAELAGVKQYIRFACVAVKDLILKGEYGFIITNPPYGQRLEDIDNAKRIYSEFVSRLAGHKDWSYYVITPIEETERLTGRKADKKRKVYNGMLKTDFYAFCGERPPKEWVPQAMPPKEMSVRPKAAKNDRDKRPVKAKPVKQDEPIQSEPKPRHIVVTKERKFTTSGKVNKK